MTTTIFTFHATMFAFQNVRYNLGILLPEDLWKISSMGSTDNRIRIVIADDHPIVLEGMVSLLSADPECEVIATASTGQQAVELFRQHNPDVLIIDLSMPIMDGIEVITSIRATHPLAKIMIVSSHKGEDAIYRAIKAGAMSYISKEAVAESLLETVKAVYKGKRVMSNEIALKYVERTSKPMLSDREVEVLTLMIQGKTNGEIAALLSLTEGTVKVHVHSLLTKLGVHDRTAAAVEAIKRGIVIM